MTTREAMAQIAKAQAEGRKVELQDTEQHSSAFDRLRKAQEMIEGAKRFAPDKVWKCPPPSKPWMPTTILPNTKDDSPPIGG